jgi:DNA-binding transcriptional MerR regulator
MSPRQGMENGELFPWEVGTDAGPAAEPDAGGDAEPEAEAAQAEAQAPTAEAEPTSAAAAAPTAEAEPTSAAAPSAEAKAEGAAAPTVAEAAPARAAPGPPADAPPPDVVAVAAPPAGGGESRPRDRAIAKREYYAISEVCELVGLKPHVLRYWETQFPQLSPAKNRSGNRVYQRKEIRLILLVKQLLYEEKHTVEAARNRLEQLRRGGELQEQTQRALSRQMLELLRVDLTELASLLGEDA